jgi:hypothetical protein
MDKIFNVNIEKQNDNSFIAYNANGDGYAIIGTGNSIAEAKYDFINSMKEIANYEKNEEGTVNEILINKPQFNIDIASIFMCSKLGDFIRSHKLCKEEQLKDVQKDVLSLSNSLISN